MVVPKSGIAAKDLDTGVEYNIATDTADQNHHVDFPAVAGRTVAWIETGANTQQIMAKNVDTGEVTQIREIRGYATSLAHLQGSGGILAWNENVTGTTPGAAVSYGIQAYYLATRTYSQVVAYQITTNKLSPSFILDSGRVALVNSTGGLHVQDLTSGSQINVPYVGEMQYLVMKGNKLLFSPGSTPIDQVYGVDLASPRGEPVLLLTTDPGTQPPYLPQYQVAIAGDWLVWQNGNSEAQLLGVQKLDLTAR